MMRKEGCAQNVELILQQCWIKKIVVECGWIFIANVNEDIREKKLNRSMWRDVEPVWILHINKMLNANQVWNKHYGLECEWIYVSNVNEYIRK